MGAGETREERYWGSHHLRATEQGFDRVGNMYDRGGGGWILENIAFTIRLKVRTLTQAQSLWGIIASEMPSTLDK